MQYTMIKKCCLLLGLAFFTLQVDEVQAQDCIGPILDFNFQVTDPSNSLSRTSQTIEYPCYTAQFILKMGQVGYKNDPQNVWVDVVLYHVHSDGTTEMIDSGRCYSDGSSAGLTDTATGENCGTGYELNSGSKLRVDITGTACDTDTGDCGTAYVEVNA